MVMHNETIILVNALSVTHQSGAHVLGGHLDQLATAFRITVIARSSMTALRERFARRVEWVGAPENTVHWLRRSAWEYKNLQAVAARSGATHYFTPSGIAASRLSIPQVVLCQNPWALVPSARRRKDCLKAWLQRRAYHNTMREAEVMVFNSKYMQQAYRANAGFEEKRGIIAYQAAEEETRQRAQEWKDTPRVPGQICCVSAMAPHKNVEAVVLAFKKRVRAESTSSAPGTSGLRPPTSQLSLHLVGSWPDDGYQQKIRALVSELGLSEQVHFHGFVSREALDRMYAESQVFCLMSRCESFGIPAIEAQLFGTPVVCSTACAVPEICGEGGLFCDPDDIDGIAEALSSLLEDSDVWRARSELALRNADRFHWQACSKPLVELFRGSA